MTDMAALNDLSRDTRLGRAQIRRDLRAGTLTLEQVLADPPPAIHTLTVLDVLRMLRAYRYQNRWEHHLGQQALRDGVNLLVRVGDASARTREWAAGHGQWHASTKTTFALRSDR